MQLKAIKKQLSCCQIIWCHNNLGNALKQIGRLEEAVISYQNAIAIKPDYAEAYNNLGITFMSLERLDEAVKSYEMAISINSEYFDAHFNLGNAFSNKAARSVDKRRHKALRVIAMLIKFDLMLIIF